MRAIILILITFTSINSFANPRAKGFAVELEGKYTTSGENGCIDAFYDVPGTTYNIEIIMFRERYLEIRNDESNLLAYIDLEQATVSKHSSGTVTLCEGCYNDVDSRAITVSKNGQITFEREITGIANDQNKHKCVLEP